MVIYKIDSKARNKQRFRRNTLYKHLSPSLKVALSVLEAGLSEDKDGRLRYNPSGMSWFSRIVDDLEGQVSRATIDQCLDSLLDEAMLAHGETEMIRVEDGKQRKWVRAYHVANEFAERLINLHKLSHDST